MIYNARVGQVEAVPVRFSEHNLFGVVVDGVAHLVPAEVFTLFFVEGIEVPVEAAPTASLRERAEKLKKIDPFLRTATELKESMRGAAPKQPLKRAPHPAAKDGLSTGQAIRRAVREEKRTTAETIDRVCVLMGWDQTDKMARDRIYSTIWTQLKGKKLEKRTDPNTQLSHLCLADGAE